MGSRWTNGRIGVYRVGQRSDHNRPWLPLLDNLNAVQDQGEHGYHQICFLESYLLWKAKGRKSFGKRKELINDAKITTIAKKSSCHTSTPGNNRLGNRDMHSPPPTPKGCTPRLLDTTPKEPQWVCLQWRHHDQHKLDPTNCLPKKRWKKLHYML